MVREGLRLQMPIREGTGVVSLHSSDTTFKENFLLLHPWRLCLAPEPVKEPLVRAFERSGAKPECPQ